jgi:two-component system, cell cycle sensor histidine kinase and response regulator CckA
MPAKLSSRGLLVLLAILIPLFIAGDHFIRFHVVLPGFVELEQQDAARDIARCKSAIQREVFHLLKLGKDWAEWNDTYQFVQDGNEDYVESNLQWETLGSTGIHLVYVINAAGRIVYGTAVDPVTQEKITIRELPQGLFSSDHYLIDFPTDSRGTSGILLTSHGPMMLASLKIFTSKGEGPSPGTIIMGRFLGEEILQDLRQQTRVEFTVEDPLTGSFTEAEKKRAKMLGQGSGSFEIVSEDKMRAFGLLEDFQGKPALLITASLPRSIMAQGRKTARYSSIVLLSAVGLIIFSAVVLALVSILRAQRRQEEIEALVEQRTDELRLSEERLHALSDASFEAIFLNEKGICVEQNRAAEVMFGYSLEEAVGQHANMWIAPEDRERVIRYILDREEKPYEVTALRKDGSAFPAEIQTREAQYRGRRVRVSAIRDLTVQKRVQWEQQVMEDRLRRSQKMEALGLMAGGVAHDLNNILSGIVNYPELMLMNLPEDSPLIKPLKAIRESGRNAAAVVDDLLTLARGVSSTRENFNLNDIVREYFDSPEFHNLSALHSQVAFRTELDAQLLNINCSVIHIKKTIMNLVTNAAEAIGDRGEIVVSSRNQYCDRPLPGHSEMQQGEYAVLSVADTGMGIPKESIDRIFEPFFSRKVVGRSGTGLGLAVAWNTVQDHGGGITVISSSKGTTFELYFPATREDLSSVPESIDIEQFRGHGERILVIDDDEGQRALALQILNLLGYRADCVASGEESLKFLAEEKVDLVILDMVMDPGMNGCDTYKKIIELHPGQKAIITSGFSESSEVRQALALGARRFVKKPYLVGMIAVVIRDTLQSR